MDPFPVSMSPAGDVVADNLKISDTLQRIIGKGLLQVFELLLPVV